LKSLNIHDQPTGEEGNPNPAAKIMKKQIINIPGIKKPSTGFNHIVKAGILSF